jgi:Uma2 family endonuclease
MTYANQHSEMVVNAPKEHQRIISKLNTGLGVLYYHQGKISLEPLPETMIDEGQTSPAPDVLLYDNENQQTRVIIEVAHTNGAGNDFKKIIRLMDENDYGVEEGFVYNYSKNIWKKYKKGQGEDTIQPSWSDLLNLDLASLL